MKEKFSRPVMAFITFEDYYLCEFVKMYFIEEETTNYCLPKLC